MDCNHYRRAVLAEPELIRRGPMSAPLRAHRESCHACGEYTERLLSFETGLERALRVDVPAAGRPRVLRGGWLAMAASVLIAIVVAGALWLSAPGSSLAADVVTHMAGEPEAWRVTDVAVPEPALEAVLRDSHLRLGNGAGIVSYASACAFRGQIVPHLVVQTGSGPVTVMVLVHEHVSKSMPFNEQGYRGVIVPVAGHGSLAVLTRAPDMDTHMIDRIAGRVEGSIHWTG